MICCRQGKEAVLYKMDHQHGFVQQEKDQIALRLASSIALTRHSHNKVLSELQQLPHGEHNSKTLLDTNSTKILKKINSNNLI